MKNRFILTAFLILLLPGGIIMAQEPVTDLKLSLKEAQDYAITHNKMVISARYDVQASKMAIWETISSGLVQVSASAGMQDNLKQMIFLIPDFFGGHPENKIPITMGSKYNSTVGLQAALPLFNAPYYIGVETVKLANTLAITGEMNTELDTREAVTSAYNLILLSEESLKILDKNLTNLLETLKSTKAMYSAGMAESTDVDQMSSNVTMVQNSRSSLQRTIELNYNLLRYQLGVPGETKITLTETLEDITAAINVETLVAQEFNYTANLNYKLVEGQERMSYLNLKSMKSQVLPSLSGVFATSTTGMGDQLSAVDWYNSSFLGLQLNIPIIASGQRYASIRKARINLEKARTTKDMISDQLKLQEKQLRYNLVNANLQYKSQKDNVDVSQRIYASMENKFRQGMASSLELTQANTFYLQAENNYITSLMSLLQTKLALDKLLNNL